MRKLLRRSWPLLFLLLAGVAPLPTPGATERGAAPGSEVVFSAGRKGGGYWNIADRFQSVSAESGLKVKILESVGSIENLERLADPNSPVNLTLSQADALMRYVGEHPDFSGRFRILESIGLECVFIIADAKGDLKSDQDLQDPKGHRIAIPGKQSGVAVTFDYMRKLVPGLENTEPVYTDTLEAMKKIRAGDSDAVDAVMLVQRPMLRKTEIHLAVSKPSVFHMVPVEDRHLLDKLPNGEEVYEFLDVPLIPGPSLSGKSVPTVCTKGLLLASGSKLDQETGKKLKRIVDFQWMRIYPTDF